MLYSKTLISLCNVFASERWFVCFVPINPMMTSLVSFGLKDAQECTELSDLSININVSAAIDSDCIGFIGRCAFFRI